MVSFRNLRRLSSLLLALALVVLAGCGSAPSQQQPATQSGGGTQSESGSSTPAPAEGDILIGAVLPITGGSAKMGQDMQNSIQMAFDEINAQGGVLGRKLKLEVHDDACDPQTAVAAANKVVSLDVVAVISGYCSGAFLPTEPIYHNAGIGVVVPAANAVSLTEMAYEEINLINATNRDQARTAADYIVNQWNAQKVALIHDNSAFALELAELTREFLQGRAEVVAFEAITPGEKDFSAVLTSLKGKEPDAIYFTGYYAEGGLIINQARGLGITARIMVGDGANDPTLVEIAGAENAEGVAITTSPGAFDFTGSNEWVPRYRERYGEPGPYSVHAYDAAYVVAEAIKQAGSTDRAAVAEAIRNINIEGISGPISFNEVGNRKDGYFIVLEVKNGEFTVVQRAPR
mgnify:CR=1 FL=1